MMSKCHLRRIVDVHIIALGFPYFRDFVKLSVMKSIVITLTDIFNS